MYNLKKVKNTREDNIKTKNSGITLIALVITIIVLILLTGVSISMLNGQNGILGKSTLASKNTEYGRAKELISLAVSEAVADQYLGGSEGTIEAKVIDKLQENGFTIGTETSGTAISAIYLDKNTITLEEGTNTENVTAIVDTAEGNRYYVLANGLYYPLEISNGSVSLGNSGKNTLSNSGLDLNDIEITKNGPITTEKTLGNGTITIGITSGTVSADTNGTVSLSYNNQVLGAINVNIKKANITVTPTTTTLETTGKTNLTVTLADYQHGEISWSVTDGASNVSIPANSTGTSVEVTGTSATQENAPAIITATYTINSVSTTASCEITVNNTNPQVGDYVTYNVPYTDMFSDTDPNTYGKQGYNFTASDGWRILFIEDDKNNTGKKNISIISTGVPARIGYDSTMDPTDSTNANYAWWGNNANNINTALDLSGYYQMQGEWTNDQSGGYAAYGLYENFTDIPFVAFDVNTPSLGNVGYWISVNGKTGSGSGSDFIASDVNINCIYCIGLYEINWAREKDDNSTDNIGVNDGDTGLLNLNGLYTENPNFGYSDSTEYTYWLANPIPWTKSNMYFVRTEGEVTSMRDFYNGIRPVVVIENATLSMNSTTGAWEISQQ